MGSFSVNQSAVLMIFQLKNEPKLAVVCLLEYTVFATGKATQHHPQHSLINMRNLCNLRLWKTLVVHSHRVQILFPWRCMEEKFFLKKEKSLAVSLWPSYFSLCVCILMPRDRSAPTTRLNAPQMKNDRLVSVQMGAHHCVEKWQLCWRELRSQTRVALEQSEDVRDTFMQRMSSLAKWASGGRLGVALHAKKNVTAGTWSFSKKKVGQSGCGGRHSSLLQLKFDDTKRIWKIQTVTAAWGSACAHPC